MHAYLFSRLPRAELVGQAAPLDEVLELVHDFYLLKPSDKPHDETHQ